MLCGTNSWKPMWTFSNIAVQPPNRHTGLPEQQSNPGQRHKFAHHKPARVDWQAVCLWTSVIPQRPCSHGDWQWGQLDLAADWNQRYRQAAWKRLAHVRHAILGSCPLLGCTML